MTRSGGLLLLLLLSAPFAHPGMCLKEQWNRRKLDLFLHATAHSAKHVLAF